MKPYLLLDAGGTLMFPDFNWIVELLASKGVKATFDELFRGFSRTNYELDISLDKKKNEEWNEKWFVKKMLSFAKIDDQTLEELTTAVIAEDRENGLWRYTFEWTKPALEKLKMEGYSMSVISNSDGRVESLLSQAALRRYFDRVYDSFIVGVSKPDAEIYKLALAELNLRSEDTLYIGDLFNVDVRGANAVGIPAIHLDPFGFYKSYKGVRIKNVSELPSFLKDISVNNEFFPFSKSDG